MSTKNYIGLLMYDISISCSLERKDYENFRKNILKKGYYQLQESVYICRYKYREKIKVDLEEIKKLAPIKSNIRFILLTKQQFSTIEILSGEKSFIEDILSRKRAIIEL